MGLILSTAYLAWGVGAQWQVERIARTSLQQAGIEAEGLLVTPAPFNTVLWRLVATTPTQYFEGHYSLLDAQPTIRWTPHDRGAALIAAHGREPMVAHMAAFTHGFYSLAEAGGRLFVTDLRMGQEPAYTFRFNLGSAAARANGGHAPTLEGLRPDMGTALPWLWQRLLGNDIPPPWRVAPGGRAG
jgi:inner membrane protein